MLEAVLYAFFFFFLISNKKFYLKKKEKKANPSTLEIFYGGQNNQEPKIQWSIKIGREK